VVKTVDSSRATLPTGLEISSRIVSRLELGAAHES
jgi:hypothetical protein